MKLNPDCMRDIMLQIESLDFNSQLSFTNLCENLTQYPTDELAYACIKLKEGGFISAMIIYADNFTHIKYLDDLTFDGHQFLNNIRSNNVWNGVKSIAGKVGSFSIESITQIASNVILELIKAQFGLSH